MLAPEPTPDPGRRPLYYPSLDGLRAVAILMVIGYHDQLLRGGFLGVQLFFVLSGYLITSLLQREQQAAGAIRLGRFYGRRFLRLAPALCLFVLVAWMVTHWLKPGLAGWLQGSWALAALLYVSNLMIAFGREYPLGIVSICWSLALEEQFYLIWPAALRVLHRARVPWRGMAGALALLLIGCVALRYALLAWHRGDPGLWLRVYFGPDTSAEGLIWGCLLALVLGRLGRLPSARSAAGMALVGAAAFAWLATRLDIVDLVQRPLLLTLTTALSALLIVAALSPGLPRRVLELRVLVWIGQLSYSLYLWHAFSIDLFAHEPRWRRYAFMLSMASASHYLVERPVQDVARRWGGLRRPHPWSLGVAAPALGAVALALAMALGFTRFTGRALPGLALAQLTQARERMADGEPARSVEQFQRAAALQPEDASLYNALGSALVQAQRPQEAAAAFQRALSLDPSLADAHVGLGALALDQDRAAEATGHLARAASLRPNDAAIRNELGVALAMQERYDEAVVQFQVALRLGAGGAVRDNLDRALRDRDRPRPEPVKP